MAWPAIIAAVGKVVASKGGQAAIAKVSGDINDRKERQHEKELNQTTNSNNPRDRRI